MNYIIIYYVQNFVNTFYYKFLRMRAYILYTTNIIYK
nr:MAG TPA: hypothetical protein [Caudoviricetes sp.]